MPPSRHGSLFAALAAVSVVAGAAAADAPSDARPAPVVVATADAAEQAYDAGVLRILVPAAATGVARRVSIPAPPARRTMESAPHAP